MSPIDHHSFHEGSENLPPAFWDFISVQERLIEAVDVLWRSPDRERGWLRSGTMSLWRQVQPDLAEAAPDDRAIVTCALTRTEQARSNEALEWVTRFVATGATRRVLALGLMQLGPHRESRIDWTRIWAQMGGRASGWTADGLRKRYGRAITGICEGLNRGASH